MMSKLNYRRTQLVLILITLFVLFASFYFEYAMKLKPCPLCLMQRLCVILILGTMGLGFRTLKRAHIVSVIQAFFACAGLFFALRQLWIQSFPAGQVPACMPGLDVLIRYFPWQAVAHALFWGDGDCADGTWSMLGLSMPAWTALYFLFVLLVSLFLYRSTKSA